MDWRTDRAAGHGTERRGYRALFARHSSLILPLLACGGVCAIAALFRHLGSEVTEGETRVFDEYILNGAKAARSAHPWIVEVMRDLSGTGSTVTLLLLTIGLSRAALGEHWATDVLGGWAFGAAWAAASLLLVARLGRDSRLHSTSG